MNRLAKITEMALTLRVGSVVKITDSNKFSSAAAFYVDDIDSERLEFRVADHGWFPVERIEEVLYVGDGNRFELERDSPVGIAIEELGDLLDSINAAKERRGYQDGMYDPDIDLLTKDYVAKKTIVMKILGVDEQKLVYLLNS